MLNSAKWIAANQQLFNTGRLFMHTNVDREAVARVDKICRETGAKVVISSTWRRFNKPEELAVLLKNHGFTGEVIGATPILGGMRGKEIDRWIAENGPIEGFVIIDDDSDMVHLFHKLVQTTFDLGLQDEHVEKAIAVLQEKV